MRIDDISQKISHAQCGEKQPQQELFIRGLSSEDDPKTQDHRHDPNQYCNVQIRRNDYVISQPQRSPDDRYCKYRCDDFVSHLLAGVFFAPEVVHGCSQARESESPITFIAPTRATVIPVLRARHHPQLVVLEPIQEAAEFPQRPKPAARSPVIDARVICRQSSAEYRPRETG